MTNSRSTYKGLSNSPALTATSAVMTVFGSWTWARPSLLLPVPAARSRPPFVPTSAMMPPRSKNITNEKHYCHKENFTFFYKVSNDFAIVRMTDKNEFYKTLNISLFSLMTRLTFPVSVTWTGYGPLKTSHLCVWTAPLHALQKVSLGLGAHLFFCVIWMPSESLSFVPVLRRSCLFQENSATKRVSTMAYSRWYVIKSYWNKKPSHLIHFY